MSSHTFMKPVRHKHPSIHLVIFFGLLFFVNVSPAASLNGKGLTNEFFAMDTGLHSPGLDTPEQKVKLLKELGYPGIGWTPPKVAEMLQALDAEGLHMPTLYIGAHIGTNEEKYDPQLPKNIELLKGRGTTIWLFINSKTDKTSDPQADSRAIATITEIANYAHAAGSRVALYPHTGYWMERVQDAVRLADKINRPDVGVTFNLCHCIRVGDREKIPQLLDLARPRLFLVTLNGADKEGDWPQLIQPLDSGNYDIAGFLGELRRINFRGPIGLQHYGIKGDAKENLQRSLAAWKKLTAK
jgi:sugar phosphate isomerase/epimerase